MQLFGITLDATSAVPWIVAAALAVGGCVLFALRPGRASRRLGRRDDRGAGRGGAPHERARDRARRPCARASARTEIIRGVDLDDRAAASATPIIGPNGAGKSTLFNLISGRFAPSAGAIRLNGEDDHRRCGRSRSTGAGLSRSFQITNIFPRLSVFENCAAPCCGRSATATLLAAASMRCADVARRAPTQILEQIGLCRAARRAGGRAHLCRAARARDRHHHRGRRRA